MSPTQLPPAPDGGSSGELLPGCPVEVWDGPYLYQCTRGGAGNVCGRHGPFVPARRCTLEPNCRRPEGHGGSCD